MLEELRIRNFAIIEALELEFDKGLNVITGETGAGKSIIVDAVELILGGKVDVSMVRAGAEKATIEGVFSLESPAKTNILDLLKRQELTDDADSEFITLSRDLRSNGRSTARVNGITVSQEILRSVGDLLVDIHGQSEHLTLFNPPQNRMRTKTSKKSAIALPIVNKSPNFPQRRVSCSVARMMRGRCKFRLWTHWRGYRYCSKN